MATAVCDTKPCDRMQGLVKSVKMQRASQPEAGLFMTAMSHQGHGTPVEVRYCPFCGTRVSQGILSRVTER